MIKKLKEKLKQYRWYVFGVYTLVVFILGRCSGS